MLFLSFLSKQNNTTTKGFGLIELMVSISIMALILGVVFTRQDSFNNTILLRSQAYEIALQLREVQLNAVSATGYNDGGSLDYYTLLGANFSTSNPNNFFVFLDTNNNNRLDNGELRGEQGVLDSRFTITEIRTIESSSSNTVSTVSILFQRPDFDAKFYNNSGVEQTNVIAVEIDVSENTTGITRTVEVTSTGQISVQ